MGISEGSDGGGIGVDCSVGTIVWVRRRNGSWWPGRILGPEELSASHLMSPRSGTPVKLLGREDASVDWYNLEKSKRVKAFRCGEFDACIERAEASQGIPIKKREKYARREDAILHALELEKQQLDIRHQRSGAMSNGISNKTLGSHKREFNTFSSSDIYMRNDEEGVHSKLANKKSQMFPRKTSLLHEEESIGNSLYINKGKLGKQSVWEEDNPEAIPRMRGLQDFGLRIAPSKRKLAQTVPWETSRKSLDNHVDVLSAGNVVGSANLPGSSKNSLAIKRKRSQSGPPEESLSKKRDRRRPLVQVLQSSAKLPPSHSFQSDYDSALMRGERDHVGIISQAKRSSYVHLPADSNDSQDQSGYPYEQMPITTSQIRMSNSLDHTGPLAEEYTSSGLVEANMSDSSETDYSEPDMEEEDNSLTDTTQTLVPGSDDCDPSMFEVAEDFGDLNHDEMPRPGYLLQVHPNEQATDVSAEVGVSKWHMKGKRNIRNLAKKPMDLTDGKITFSSNCNGSIKGTAHGSRGSTFKSTRVEPSGQRTLGRGIYHKKETSHYAFDGGDFDLDDRQTMGYRNHRSPFPLKVGKDSGINHSSFNDSDDDSHVLSPSGWEANDSSPVQAEYWEGSDQCFGPIYSGRLSDELEPSLVDVNLKVQASYQGEHVPLVSLMSRLNGKAIIGHPVQVEILEDGSSGYLVPKYGVGLDESMAPPSVWRTARRTAKQRVPRSNPAASALDAEGAEPLHYSDLESKPPVKKAFSGYSNLQGKLSKKSSSHAQRASGSGKFQKKLLKRASLSSQKTRTLSSLATEQKRRGESGDVKHPRDNDILGGLIKPEGGVPLVTCVPVKVVFSRILEAVGRPSSAVAHRARMSSPTIRGPS